MKNISTIQYNYRIITWYFEAFIINVILFLIDEKMEKYFRDPEILLEAYTFKIGGFLNFQSFLLFRYNVTKK